MPKAVKGFTSLSHSEQVNALVRARKQFVRGNAFDLYVFLVNALVYEYDICRTMADLGMPFDCHDWTTFIHWSRDFRNMPLLKRAAHSYLDLVAHMRAKPVRLTESEERAFEAGVRAAREVLLPPPSYEPAYAGGRPRRNRGRR